MILTGVNFELSRTVNRSTYKASISQVFSYYPWIVFSQKHVFLSFMIRFPSTRLGRLARAKTRQEAMEHCNIYYDKLVPEYFFDRNPENFSSILGE